MIEFVSGDFFDYEADIRVNTVNCVGVMGTGVALIFKKKFPDMFNDYLQACNKKEVKPGKPHVWIETNLLSECIIINLPTKVHWRNPSEYEYIEAGLVWLRKYLEDKEESTITLPALGCGNGGLDWGIVKKMIIEHLTGLDTKIFVFEPNNSFKEFDDTSLTNKFEDQNISKLLPSDKYYPHNLVRHYTSELYATGNIELLNKETISFITHFKPGDREKQALLKVIEELPTNRFVAVLGLGSSYEFDLAKEMLTRGFDVIFIVSVGILNLKVRTDLKEVWKPDKVLVLSMVDPTQTWNRYENINALKLRLSFSKILLINSLDLEFIQKYIVKTNYLALSIFYLNYWNDEVEFMNKVSAQKLGISQTTMKPNVLPLLGSLNKKTI